MALTLQIQQKVCDYVVLSFISRGAFGQVFRAQALGSDEVVALKIVELFDAVKQGGLREYENVRQLLSYTQHADHNVTCLMPIYKTYLLDADFQPLPDAMLHAEGEVLENQHAAYIVYIMPLASSSLKGKKLEKTELIEAMTRIARALDFLNLKLQIQHRDVKPGNLLVWDDKVYLADFGELKSGIKDDLTVAAAGSLAYMAPEISKGKTSRFSDQYSLARTYFELRTGKVPELDSSWLNGLPDSVERDVLRRATDDRPDKRFQRCEEFVEQLRQILTATSARQSPRSKFNLVAGRNVAGIYELVEEIGKGAFGTVWKAAKIDEKNRPLCALKFIAIDPIAGYREYRAFQEIIKNRIQHPNLLETRQAWLVDRNFEPLDLTDLENNLENTQNSSLTSSLCCLVIESELGDQSLEKVLENAQSDDNKGIPVRELMSYMKQAAAALHYLNQKKEMVHRDVKPSNLLLVGKTLKVFDFGTAKVYKGFDVTASIMQIGSLPYMAPEQLRSEVTKTSDQFALACTYIHLRTGLHPKRSHTRPDYHNLRGAELRVLEKATAQRPEERYEHCKEFINALDAATKPRYLQLRYWLVSLLIASLIGIGIFSIPKTIAIGPNPREDVAPKVTIDNVQESLESGDGESEQTEAKKLWQRGLEQSQALEKLEASPQNELATLVIRLKARLGRNQDLSQSDNPDWHVRAIRWFGRAIDLNATLNDEESLKDLNEIKSHLNTYAQSWEIKELNKHLERLTTELRALRNIESLKPIHQTLWKSIVHGKIKDQLGYVKDELRDLPDDLSDDSSGSQLVKLQLELEQLNRVATRLGDNEALDEWQTLDSRLKNRLKKELLKRLEELERQAMELNVRSEEIAQLESDVNKWQAGRGVLDAEDKSWYHRMQILKGMPTETDLSRWKFEDSSLDETVKSAKSLISRSKSGMIPAHLFLIANVLEKGGDPQLTNDLLGAIETDPTSPFYSNLRVFSALAKKGTPAEIPALASAMRECRTGFKIQGLKNFLDARLVQLCEPANLQDPFWYPSKVEPLLLACTSLPDSLQEHSYVLFGKPTLATPKTPAAWLRMARDYKTRYEQNRDTQARLDSLKYFAKVAEKIDSTKLNAGQIKDLSQWDEKVFQPVLGKNGLYPFNNKPPGQAVKDINLNPNERTALTQIWNKFLELYRKPTSRSQLRLLTYANRSPSPNRFQPIWDQRQSEKELDIEYAVYREAYRVVPSPEIARRLAYCIYAYAVHSVYAKPESEHKEVFEELSNLAPQNLDPFWQLVKLECELSASKLGKQSLVAIDRVADVYKQDSEVPYWFVMARLSDLKKNIAIRIKDKLNENEKREIFRSAMQLARNSVDKSSASFGKLMVADAYEDLARYAGVDQVSNLERARESFKDLVGESLFGTRAKQGASRSAFLLLIRRADLTGERIKARETKVEKLIQDGLTDAKSILELDASFVSSLTADAILTGEIKRDLNGIIAGLITLDEIRLQQPELKLPEPSELISRLKACLAMLEQS